MANNLGELLERLAGLKDQMDEINTTKSDLQKEIDQLEFQVISEMERNGVDKTTCNRATASLKIKMCPQIKDMDSLLRWCYENNRPDMLQKRVSDTAFKEFYEENNEYPDGIDTYEKKTINFRRR
jgi:predicted transcriptional regulator